MINGKTTVVQFPGIMVHDVGRPYAEPAIFATERGAARFLRKAGNWPNRTIRRVAAGDIIPFHHWRNAYSGYDYSALRETFRMDDAPTRIVWRSKWKTESCDKCAGFVRCADGAGFLFLSPAAGTLERVLVVNK